MCVCVCVCVCVCGVCVVCVCVCVSVCLRACVFFPLQETDDLNYIALSFPKRLTTSKRSSGKTSQEETIYSQITKQ